MTALQIAREAAYTYSLDFEVKCAFPHEIKYDGIINGNGEIVKIPMASGRIALYKAYSETVALPGCSKGQLKWKFTFQGYENE